MRAAPEPASLQDGAAPPIVQGAGEGVSVSARDIWRSLRSGHWPTLLAAWLHFEVSFMVWLLVGALAVPIAEEFGLGPGAKGLLVAVPLLSGALLRVPVGLLADRHGAKPVGVAILGCAGLGLLWGWNAAGGYVEMLGVGLAVGVAGASFAVALPLASLAYPPAHQGLALGVAASANSGTVLAMLVAPKLAEAFGWRGVFGVLALPVFATLLLFAALVPGTPGRARGATDSPWPAPLADALRRRSLHWLCGLYAVTFGGFVGLASFLPTFLHDQYGLDIVTAGAVTAGCALAGSLVRPVGGHAADRRGALGLLRALFPLVALLGLGVGALPPLAWAAPLLFLSVTLLGFGNGVVFRLVSDRFPKQIGLASGLVGAAGAFGGFLLPLSLGLLDELTGSYRSGFLAFAGAALGAWASVEAARRRARNAQAGEIGGFSR